MSEIKSIGVVTDLVTGLAMVVGLGTDLLKGLVRGLMMDHVISPELKTRKKVVGERF